MSNKFYTVEKIHELLTKYDASIISYISTLSNGKGFSIYNNYSELPNNLTEDTIAYCKNDYIDNTDVDNPITYKSGFYIYNNDSSIWEYIKTSGADSSELESLLDNKVDKEDGKGLSTNDFTNEDKHLLANSMLKSDYVSEINEGNVKVADKSLKIDGVEEIQAGQYYGKNNLGEVGFHYLPINPTTVPETEQRYISPAVAENVYIIDSNIDLDDTKLYIQCLKTVEGLQDVILNINIFTTEYCDNYYYDTENVIIDKNMRIKTKFECNMSFIEADNIYESDEINKSEFIRLQIK